MVRARHAQEIYIKINEASGNLPFVVPDTINPLPQITSCTAGVDIDLLICFLQR